MDLVVAGLNPVQGSLSIVCFGLTSIGTKHYTYYGCRQPYVYTCTCATIPVLKAGHPGVPCYMYMYMYIHVSFVFIHLGLCVHSCLQLKECVVH